MSRGLPHRARTGIAAGLTLAFLVLASTPAQADQTRQSEWWLRALHVTTAWDVTRGSGITIAVLDTGVDPAQPDLKDSVTTGPDYTNSGRTIGGPFWGIHGTEIASLIAGHGHGAKQANGIIGIAPSAKILSVRVTLESNDPQLANPAIADALPGAIARGIRWAVRHHATVIDLPLDPVTTTGAMVAGSAAERAAVAYALSRHVVLVAPAGDEGASSNAVNYPAAYHGVIAVGAFDQGFVRAPFSSHRPYVTVTAAGAGVTAANPSSLAANPYTQLNSTSAASAMVAGIVALIRAQFPKLTPAQVTRALAAGTVFRQHGGRRDGSGFGSVDAAKALTKAAGIAEAAPSSAASGAAQSPPPRPVTHTSPLPRNIRSKLVMDAAIAGAVFLLLLGLIFAVRAWRRRHARTARLAEVRAATQVPARKPATAKKSTAKKGPVQKGPAKKGKAAKGTAKKGAPAAPRAPVAVGGGAPDADAEPAPELQPAGFIPAPLSPAIPRSASPTFGGSAPPTFGGSAAPTFGGSAAPTFGGSAAPTFGGSASTGFAGSSGFGGSSSPGFTGSAMSGSAGSASSGFTGSASPGFTGSASPGFAGSASPGLAGSASSGFTGSAMSGFAGPASSGFSGSASSGLADSPTPPTGPDASGSVGGPAGPASPDVPLADTAPPAELAVPVDPASSPSQESTAMARANEPPWAPIPYEPRGLAADAAGAAIPGSAFPAAAGTAGSAAAAALGGAGQNPMGIRRPPTAAHRPAPARIAQVSGRPPWEPAPRPDSELPWAQAPVPPRGGAGSLPKPEQTRPALPSWDALAEDVWPGGPRSAALHPSVSSPVDQDLGGPADKGSTGIPGLGARPPGGPVRSGGPAPPQPAAPGRARSAEHRPGRSRDPDAGATPFSAAQSEPAPPVERIGRPGTGPGFAPASRPAKAPASPPAGSAASPPTDPATIPATSTAASPPTGTAASPATGTAADPATRAAARPPDSAATSTASDPAASPATDPAASPATDPAASPATGTAAGAPDSATANLPTDVSASRPPAPLPRRLSTPPLRAPNAFPPSQPGAGSSLFRSASQPPFPPARRPATEPGPAGAWQPSAGAASFPPNRKAAPGTPASGASAPDVPASGSPAAKAPPPGARTADATAADGPATDATSAEPGLSNTGKTPPGGPRVTGGPASAPGPGTPFPRAARPRAGGSRPTSGVPPWEITDSFLAVPSAPAETGPAGAEPKTPRPPGGLPSAGTAGAGDSTENFAAVDPAAEQRSFPRADPGDGNDSLPKPRPRTDEDAFRLFPPVRHTGNLPPAPPVPDDQD